MEHEKAYVFSHERPAKRRRVENYDGLDSSLSLRHQLYRDLWAKQQQRINEVIKLSNEATLNEVSTFIRDQRPHEGNDGLPAGFLLAGPSIAAHSLIFQQLQERSREEVGNIFIPVSSSDASNLKTLLKAIIKSGTSQKKFDEDEVDLLPSKQIGRKLLDYDLQLLHERVKDNNIQRCIVVFRDCEAFDSSVLSEAIELLSVWSQRIPFLLLFGIATSVENLQERLSQKAARCLAGQQFDVIQSDEILEQIFSAATIHADQELWMGPQLSGMLLQRHHENLLSSQDFVDSLQYAYMAHFHANPLSIFLSRDVKLNEISAEHFDALRNAPSFRQYAERCLSNPNDASQLKGSLESDQTLLETVQNATSNIDAALVYISKVVQVTRAIQQYLLRGTVAASNLYTMAISGALSNSPTVRELLLAVKKTPSDILLQTLEAIDDVLPDDHASDLEILSSRLEALIKEDDSGQPLRSEHDIRNDTMRTTVVAQKVQLSRHKAKLSEKDEAYSKIVTAFHDLLASMYKGLKKPFDMFGHEIMIYDQRMPHRAALMPKPRFSIERALCSPHDYLTCQCCGNAKGRKHSEEATLSATLPSTALLYRLYLESGALINASDLWSAFAAIMECESDEEKAKIMPLFQRSLAELKYLGFVKSTRKKTDHVVKVAWKGL